MAEYKVEIGQALPPEVWREARDNLSEAFPYVARFMRTVNFEGRGQEDEQEFMFHAALAIQAMTYVAEFASDKCRIIVLPDHPGEPEEKGG